MIKAVKLINDTRTQLIRTRTREITRARAFFCAHMSLTWLRPRSDQRFAVRTAHTQR